MLLIFGTRAYETLIVLISFVCPHCGVNAPQRVTRLDNRFTLFFVPLFRVSSKHYVECSHCGTTTALTAEQAAHSVEWAASRA